MEVVMWSQPRRVIQPNQKPSLYQLFLISLIIPWWSIVFRCDFYRLHRWCFHDRGDDCWSFCGFLVWIFPLSVFRMKLSVVANKIWKVKVWSSFRSVTTMFYSPTSALQPLDPSVRQISNSGIGSAVQTVKLQENGSHRGAVKPELSCRYSQHVWVYFLFPDLIGGSDKLFQTRLTAHCFYFMFTFQKKKLVSKMFPWLNERLEQWKQTVSLIKS